MGKDPKISGILAGAEWERVFRSTKYIIILKRVFLMQLLPFFTGVVHESSQAGFCCGGVQVQDIFLVNTFWKRMNLSKFKIEKNIPEH